MRTPHSIPPSLRGRARVLGRAGLPILFLGLAAGCNTSQVAHYRVPKGSDSAAAQAMPPMGMPPGAMPGGAGAPAQAHLQWTLPEGWTQEPGSGMRAATLKPPVAGKVDVSVVMLPGTAGGELANVNRWRNQLGLPPLDAAAEAAQRTVVRTKAGELAAFDFTGTGKGASRTVAGLITTSDGNTWFLKMDGAPGPVGQAKPAFMRLMGSIRLD